MSRDARQLQGQAASIASDLTICTTHTHTHATPRLTTRPLTHSHVCTASCMTHAMLAKSPTRLTGPMHALSLILMSSLPLSISLHAVPRHVKYHYTPSHSSPHIYTPSFSLFSHARYTLQHTPQHTSLHARSLSLPLIRAAGKYVGTVTSL